MKAGKHEVLFMPCVCHVSCMMHDGYIYMNELCCVAFCAAMCRPTANSRIVSAIDVGSWDINLAKPRFARAHCIMLCLFVGFSFCLLHLFKFPFESGQTDGDFDR